MKSPDESPSPPSPPGRLRAAWRVLRGQSLVPDQIQAEWVEYQLIFNDLLSRLSVQLARAAKAERKRLRRLAEDSAPSSPSQLPLSLPPSSSPKAALRSRAAELRGLGPLRAALQSSHPNHHHPSPQAEELPE